MNFFCAETLGNAGQI